MNAGETLEDEGRAPNSQSQGDSAFDCFPTTTFMETEIRNGRPCTSGVVHGEDGSSKLPWELPSVNPNSNQPKLKEKVLLLHQKERSCPSFFS